MRKGPLASIVAVFLCASLAVACSLEPVGENSSINHYIFPYVRFELLTDSEGSCYYSASIRKGASVANVYIPAYVADSKSETGGFPVKVFTGFESDDDIVNLNSITFESSKTEIKLNSLDQASILEAIHVKGIDNTTKETGTWRNLPDFPHTGTREFVGWFTADTDEQVHNGDDIDPNHMSIHAKFVDVALTRHAEARPTCTEPGSMEYWQCSGCGKCFGDANAETEIGEGQTVSPALGHATLHVGEKPAACEEKGVGAHWECSRCHASFVDEGATEPTTLTDLTIAALGHDWVYKHGEGIGDGHWKECTRCQETKDSEPHGYSEGEVTKEPTHESVGTMTYTCGECGATKTEDIVPIGDHIWIKTDTVVSPTCEGRGYTVYKCTVSGCSSTYNGDYADPLGHTIETCVEAKEPTCTKAGNSRYYICSACEKLFKDQNGKNPTTLEETKTPALGHLFNEKVFERDDAHHWHSCTREGCDDPEGSIKDKSTHTYDQRTTTHSATEATCTEPATYYFTCACGKKGTDTFPYGEPLGHQSPLAKADETASTCTEHGHYAYWYCGRCGQPFSDAEGNRETTLEDTAKPLAPHVWDEGWQTDGERHWHVCENGCGATDKVEAHSEVLNYNSDCHWYECTVCGKRFGGMEAHTFDGTGIYCTKCGYIYEKPDGESGFDVKPQYQDPTGEIASSYDETLGKWTFTLKATNAESVPTGWQWSVDGVEVEGADRATFEFVPPREESYVVFCLFWNDLGAGSSELNI